MQRPRLKAHLLQEVIGTSQAFLLAEDRSHVIQGEDAVRVLAYLDGRHTVDEIVAALDGELPMSHVMFTIHKFDMLGYLADGRPDMPHHDLAYWDLHGIDPHLVNERLAGSPISLVRVGEVDTGPLLAALRANGLYVRPSTVTAQTELTAADAGMTIVAVDDYLDPALDRLNAAFLEQGRAWLPVKPCGRCLWMGPIFRPGDTGCWRCLAQRVEGNRQVEHYLLTKRDDTAPFRTSIAMLASGVGAASAMLADALSRAVVTGSSELLDGRMVTFDLQTLETHPHQLVRRPQCSACGDPALTRKRDPKIELVSRKVTFKADGGYRIQSPRETFDRLEKHVSPFLGAVTKLGAVSQDDSGVAFSYTAGHNFAVVKDNMAMLRRNLRGLSGGKGRTDVQAKTSAVCEAIERYSGVWQDEEPIVRGSLEELGPERAVPPNDLMLFSDHQFSIRKQWNHDPATRLHRVPDRLDPAERIDWSPCWSLTHDRERLVPAAYVWYGHPEVGDRYFCYSDANGCASGNTLEEAILQGFSELVERDSVAMWWYNRLRRPQLDLDALQDPYIDTLREFYAGMNRSLWVLDITSDIGIPAFVGVSHREDHPVQDILIGFGAHLDPRLACMRALTEVNQFLPAIERRKPDGSTLYLEDDPATLQWWREATVESEPWVAPDPKAPKLTFADYPALASDDLKADVEACVARAADRDLEVIVLDMTRPDLDLSVVKVMAPGMRHFWRRLGPGRLYDVPVSQGWLPGPLGEDELNPRSVFF
jgi:oxazoline/thiazoline synthase